jgi:hypothetical protein
VKRICDISIFLESIRVFFTPDEPIVEVLLEGRIRPRFSSRQGRVVQTLITGMVTITVLSSALVDSHQTISSSKSTQIVVWWYLLSVIADVQCLVAADDAVD